MGLYLLNYFIKIIRTHNMNIQKIVEKVYGGELSAVSKSLDKQILKLQRLKYMAQVASFVDYFSSEIKSQYPGSNISLSIGHHTNKFPQTVDVFYKINGGQLQTYEIDNGYEISDFMEHIEDHNISSIRSTELKVDHLLHIRLLEMFLGAKLANEYFEACVDAGVFV